MKVGIFGGSFNPPHMGHINCVQTIIKKVGLAKVFVVPANQNPLRVKVDAPTNEQRFEMAKQAFVPFGNQFEVDDLELNRGGSSYTIDTILEYRKKYEAKDLYLIIGSDNFEEFGQWKSYDKILNECNLIVASRPGFEWPHSAEEVPEFLKKHIEDFDFNFIELKSGRSIQFVSLEDIEISSTELRKWLRSGKPVDKYVPLTLEKYIKEQGLYKPITTKISDYKKLTEFCCQTLHAKKAINVRAFDLTRLSAVSEYVVVASGTSVRHAASMAENVVRSVKEEFGVHPQSIEGVGEGRWVVIDYGSLIVHVFYDFVRLEYNIEALWSKGQEMRIKEGG